MRLWVRKPGAPRISVRLTVEGRAPVDDSVPLSPDTDWTGVAQLSLLDPAPGAAFTCTVEGRELRGRLAPLPGTPAALTFAFGSCHMPYASGPAGIELNPAAAIYEPAAALLRDADAHFLLLVGDQIYADALPGISVRDEFRDAEAPPAFAGALAAYRRVYRGYFGMEGFRRLRESVPTCCMWDDHDIFNDWGSMLQESPLDRRLFQAAGRAYCEYQHQRNPGGGLTAPPYPYLFFYGDVGFLVLDLRGARDYAEGHLLGRSQWEWARDTLRAGVAGVSTLLVVASVPVAQVSRWFVELLQRAPSGRSIEARDRWCSRHFVGARDALLAELMAWQTAQPGRQVVLLSGDVHAAGAFTIRDAQGPGVVQQFTSSALSTQPGWRQKLPLAVAARFPNLLEPRWRFQRHLACYANNIGLVRVAPLASGGHAIEFSVHAWLPREQRLYCAGTVRSLPA